LNAPRPSIRVLPTTIQNPAVFLANLTKSAAVGAWRILEGDMGRELTSDEVRKVCDPEIVTIETTQELSPLEGIIGQKRAVEALQFGLDMLSGGFNVFVAGRPGTGKTTAVKAFLEERAKKQPVPSDWCYVNNFRDPYRPKALMLPAGRGCAFQRDVLSFVEQAQKEISEAFESEQYSERREKTQAELEARRKALFSKMEEQAKAAGRVGKEAESPPGRDQRHAQGGKETGKRGRGAHPAYGS
jgi:hypothetical protein